MMETPEKRIANRIREGGWEGIEEAEWNNINADALVAEIPLLALVRSNPTLARVTENAVIAALRSIPRNKVAGVISNFPRTAPSYTEAVMVIACQLSYTAYTRIKLRTREFNDGVMRTCPALFSKMPLKIITNQAALTWLWLLSDGYDNLISTATGIGQIQAGFSRIIRAMPVTSEFMRIVVNAGAIDEAPTVIDEIVANDMSLPINTRNDFITKLTQARLRRAYAGNKIGRPFPAEHAVQIFPLFADHNRRLVPSREEIERLRAELREAQNTLERFGFVNIGYRKHWRLRTARGNLKLLSPPFFTDRMVEIANAVDAERNRRRLPLPAVPPRPPAPVLIRLPVPQAVPVPQVAPVIDRDGFLVGGVRGYRLEAERNATPRASEFIGKIASEILAECAKDENDIKSPRAPSALQERGHTFISKGEEETCFVCTCKIESGDCVVVCGCEEKHTFCTHCFAFMVRVQCNVHHESFNLSEWESRGGKVKCTKNADCVFPDTIVAVAAATDIGLYISSLTELGRRREEISSSVKSIRKTKDAVRSTVTAFTNPELRERLRREAQIKSAIKHIQDFILTHRCPSCFAPFSDFTHCSCVKCDCGVYFCALCRKFSSADTNEAHTHVKDDCVYNPQRGTSYAFVDDAVLAQIAQSDKNSIAEYIASTGASPDVKIEIVFGVSKDLVDNKISLDEIQALAETFIAA